MSEREVILEYTTPVPDKMKDILVRALRITFDGGKIEWVNDKKIKIKDFRLRGIYVSQ